MKGLRQRVERLTRDWEEPILTTADVFALVDDVVSAIRPNVTDQKTLGAIAADLCEVATRFEANRR